MKLTLEKWEKKVHLDRRSSTLNYPVRDKQQHSSSHLTQIHPVISNFCPEHHPILKGFCNQFYSLRELENIVYNHTAPPGTY